MNPVIKAITSRPWNQRRRYVALIMTFCAFEVLYLTFFGADTILNSNIVLGCFGLAGATAGSYLFGAAWDDNNMAKIEAQLVGPQPLKVQETGE